MERFKGRVAVVTGAASGIGKAIATAMVQEGTTVVANDISQERLDRLARELSVKCVVGDTSDPETARRIVEEALATAGRVDILFNNAGIAKISPAEDFSVEDWRRIIDVNLSGYFYVAREVGRVMIRQRSGAILNIASTAGISGVPLNVAYTASKHGVVGLTRALAVEWARYGIRVNALCPGLTMTELVREVEAQAPELFAARRARVLFGRPAEPEEQARVALFLVSDDAGYINGLVANVDAGNYSLYSGYDVPKLS